MMAMAMDYVKEWQKYGPKAASISANITNGRRRLNFLFNLMLRNDFSEKDAKKATKKMDVHNLLSGYAGAIYHRNTKDPMSALTKQEAINFLHKVENDTEDLSFDIDEKHPDQSETLRLHISTNDNNLWSVNDDKTNIDHNDNEMDVGTIKRLFGKIIDDSMSDDESVNGPASKKMNELTKWSEKKAKEAFNRKLDSQYLL